MYSGVIDNSVSPSEDFLLGIKKFDQKPVLGKTINAEIKNKSVWRGPLSESNKPKKYNEALLREDPLAVIHDQEIKYTRNIVLNQIKNPLPKQNILKEPQTIDNKVGFVSKYLTKRESRYKDSHHKSSSLNDIRLRARSRSPSLRKH